MIDRKCTLERHKLDMGEKESRLLFDLEEERINLDSVLAEIRQEEHIEEEQARLEATIEAELASLCTQTQDAACNLEEQKQLLISSPERVGNDRDMCLEELKLL